MASGLLLLQIKVFQPTVSKVTIRSGLNPDTGNCAYLVILHTAGEVTPRTLPDEELLEEAGAFLEPVPNTFALHS